MSWKSFQTDHTVFGIFPAPLVAANMFCSITLNFTVDKISVNFLVDSEAAGEYNPKKMPENRRKNNYDDYKTTAG